jgi:hypothetical protein
VDDVVSILANAFGVIDIEGKSNVFTIVVVVVRPLRHPRPFLASDDTRSLMQHVEDLPNSLLVILGMFVWILWVWCWRWRWVCVAGMDSKRDYKLERLVGGRSGRSTGYFSCRCFILFTRMRTRSLSSSSRLCVLPRPRTSPFFTTPHLQRCSIVTSFSSVCTHTGSH